MNKRIEDIIAETRLNEILHKNEAEKQKNTVIWTLAIIGAVAAVAAIAYAVYRFVSPDYLDDFEDDFDDDFVVNEEQWTAQIAYYLDEHIDQFAIIEK